MTKWVSFRWPFRPQQDRCAERPGRRMSEGEGGYYGSKLHPAGPWPWGPVQGVEVECPASAEPRSRRPGPSRSLQTDSQVEVTRISQQPSSAAGGTLLRNSGPIPTRTPDPPADRGACAATSGFGQCPCNSAAQSTQEGLELLLELSRRLEAESLPAPALGLAGVVAAHAFDELNSPLLAALMK